MKTKRMQVLIEPEEYAALEELAGRRGVSVAELIREAVRRCYFPPADRRREAVEEILSMEIPVDDWERLEEEIEGGREEGSGNGGGA